MGRRPLELQDQEPASGSVVDGVFEAIQQGESLGSEGAREREREEVGRERKLIFSHPPQNTKTTDVSDPAFDPKAVGQVVQASNARDPAPLVPALASGKPAFGESIEVVNVIVVIVLERLWQYFIISAVVPVLTATLLSFVVFAVPPNKIDTRLQTATGLFLSLIAIQVSARTRGERGERGKA